MNTPNTTPAPQAPAKGKYRARTKAKVQAKPAPKAKVTNGKAPARKYEDDQRITVLAQGKENPRSPGKPPFKRYETLLKSPTVGAFLKVHPKWASTIARAVREGLVRVS
jgi:hypothetical protein